MCASTRFPEAIPLRNIKTKNIVRALVKFFTFVGLPKSVQSDQGSNFMSGIFQQIMHELGITQYKSSPYHPESQGALERFHQTLRPASVAQLDAPSDWRPGGRGFNPRRGRQHSFVEIDHEIFSTVILSLPLIQEGQLSVSGERMCTKLVNRLED